MNVQLLRIRERDILGPNQETDAQMSKLGPDGVQTDGGTSGLAGSTGSTGANAGTSIMPLATGTVGTSVGQF